jgi:hypothetical protein
MGPRKGAHAPRRTREYLPSRASRCIIVIILRNMGFAVRRFVGIVSGVSALYLTVGAVDAPCKDHSRDRSSSSVMAPMASDVDSHHELPAKQERAKALQDRRNSLLCRDDLVRDDHRSWRRWFGDGVFECRSDRSHILSRTI